MSIFEWTDPMREAVIAEGLVSQWKYLLELPTPELRAKAKEKLYKELVDEEGYWEPAVRMYLELGPILAEHKAISKASRKMPQIRMVAPEILTVSEAMAVALKETPLMSMGQNPMRLRMWLKVRKEMRNLDGYPNPEIMD